MSSLLPTQRPDAVERRRHDHGTNELLNAAARATGPERDRLIDEVVVANLGLADAVSRRYGNRGIEAEELRQVARLGLVAAARRYDPDRGDFVGFAVPTILGEVKRHFRDHAWSVRPPRRVQELRSTLAAGSAELCQTLGSMPTPADLARHLGISVDDVLEAAQSGRCYAAISIDQPAGDAPDDGPMLADTLGTTDAGFDRAEAMVALADACRVLSPRDARIVHLRYFCEWTQHEIGKEVGVTQMQVSRVLTRILSEMRQTIGEVGAG